MKKLTALLALFLLLTLLAQGACAAALETTFYSGKATFEQDESRLLGKVGASHSADDFEVRLLPLEIDHSAIQSSFESHFNSDYPLAPGYTRKALYVNMGLWYNWGSLKGVELIAYPEGAPDFAYNLIFNPIVSLSAFIPEGTTFQNLKVFHGTQSNDANSTLAWKSVELVLHDGEPDFEDDGKTFTDNEVKVFPVTSDSDHYLRLSVGHFSPFVIVWDELNTGAPGVPGGSGAPVPAPLTPPDVPQTGDSASFAPWLLLLGGACAMLALRKKSLRA